MAYKEVSRVEIAEAIRALAERNQSQAHSVRDRAVERYRPEIRYRS